MSKFKKNGLSDATKELLLNKALNAKQKKQKQQQEKPADPTKGIFSKSINKKWTSFEQFDGYKEIEFMEKGGKTLGINSPFFKTHDGIASATSRINGKDYINFSSYNYLGFGGHPEVIKASQDALERYGTTVSASRMVSGERTVQQSLEKEIANLYQVDDALTFVSGHATNVSVIGYLFGPKDLILHDSLAHNSILQGAQLSGAKRIPFRHNDWQHLEDLLSGNRSNFERVLVVIEGLYSMDGDIPDLEKFVEIKKRHHAFLMVDEAHSMGVLGNTGRGIAEHLDIDFKSIDIWMGTLSKSFASCGGYIAGEHALIKHLRHYAPGFLYSVGIAPPLAAASLKSIKLMNNQPERVKRLQSRGELFLRLAKEAGIDTGKSEGYSVIPAMAGSSKKAVELSNIMFDAGINVQPILRPAVEDKAARLRFFISSEHTDVQITTTIQTLSTALNDLK
ncbi:aminotransferase class I/II-fold pyridoxal phosphate-dependent enzyme [Leucothrix arctica]|uniref:8-amino-7-oxononanoate synthase n=1 Tax=Leucothrix arctica TaxID=1481894 RepID=A0A317C9G4_9GAMM|nr:aminotransferase class I/II-fold pyridoxal phosphate-dependent enzyme [Leucothrix arctica]PWQ95009.1 8-amino-7-oxononanoate synthase [Leucothrix arctica]